MSDLIDRKKALDEISKIDTSIIPSGWVKGYVDETIKETQRIIRTLPSAAPERKKGQWIDEGFYADGHGAHAFRCSECGGHIIEYDVDPFCRWCGADMRGDE